MHFNFFSEKKESKKKFKNKLEEKEKNFTFAHR